jgi:hypothetical protein
VIRVVPVYRTGGIPSYFGLEGQDPAVMALVCYRGPAPRLEADQLCWTRRGRGLRLAAPALVLAARLRMLGTRVWDERREVVEKRKPMPRRRRDAAVKGRRRWAR